MARPIEFPEVVQFRLPRGTLAAVETRRLPDEKTPHLWRRMVAEWLGPERVDGREMVEP